MSDRRSRITAQTGVVGVIGHPVSHSLSPRIHNAAFEAQGLDLMYVAFDVTPQRLADAVLGIRALGIRGVNVTLPHKETIIGLLDEIDPVARRIEAVNTVVNDAGRLKGYNTDVSGFDKALRLVAPDGARGRRCLLVGAGGAARAVLAALVDEGAARVSVFNRTLSRAETLCRVAGSWGRTQCVAIAEHELATAAAGADLLVNATSVGLAPKVKELPVPVDILHSGLRVVDLVYGKGPTRLVREARGRGVHAVDGLEMLLMQAGDAYRLWTGNAPPLEAMRASIEREEG